MMDWPEAFGDPTVLGLERWERAAAAVEAEVLRRLEHSGRVYITCGHCGENCVLHLGDTIYCPECGEDPLTDKPKPKRKRK